MPNVLLKYLAICRLFGLPGPCCLRERWEAGLALLAVVVAAGWLDAWYPEPWFSLTRTGRCPFYLRQLALEGLCVPVHRCSFLRLIFFNWTDVNWAKRRHAYIMCKASAEGRTYLSNGMRIWEVRYKGALQHNWLGSMLLFLNKLQRQVVWLLLCSSWICNDFDK